MANPDYIVVGSGAGGGPLAARLAELGHRVLLLEAGGDDAPWNYQVPVFHGLASEDEAMRLDHYVRHYADDARQRRDSKYERERNGILYPRARTLGGCTAHYAMIIVRPHDSDWQAIRDATGDASWAPAAMDRYFQRVERCHYRSGASGGHGTEGWLPTRLPDVFDLAREAIRSHDTAIGQIALEAVVAARVAAQLGPINPAAPLLDLARAIVSDPVHAIRDLFNNNVLDPNDRRVLDRHGTGLLMVPTAIDIEMARRSGTRERIRAAAKSTGRLEVRLHCHVTGLVFDAHDEGRVVGVRCLPGTRLYRADRDAGFGSPGEPEELRAEREVILSAGAFISPQLLMLSGIGPAGALGRLDRQRDLGLRKRQPLM